ncbi:MAG: endopeptidase La [SAR324 cluster bacterium]|uniref:Lon protease n=1 Tax=SAR324 cluster bacterium TaxID=2024889 RepID=A0A7X9FSR2_9DELT|nr:endopeptidase La [SAR324 cluster bacterium]
MKASENNSIPLLALRELVVFPQQVVPLFVGREKSVRAIEEAQRRNCYIMLAAQKDARTSNPTEKDIYSIGTLGEVVQLIRLADGPIKVLVEGKARAKIKKFQDGEEFLTVEADEIQIPVEVTTEIKALMRSVNVTFDNYVKLGKKVNPEMIMQVNAIEDPSRLADAIVVQLNLKLEDRQDILETISPQERLDKILGHMKSEIEILQVEKRIRNRVKKQMEKTQKEYYLNEQMRAIQKELGEKDDFRNEITELEDKLKAKDMPDDAREKTEKEIRKLKMMSPMSAEATVVRNYVDWMLALPWNEISEAEIDIEKARDVLEADHYGLEKIKERILEYLAVQKLVDKQKGPILCLVGPPGVGKTSLGRSIARATNREFVRVALGGVRDEAEVRGHRRTYIGALPGKIIQSLKKAGKSNPVFLLDEVDKMSTDFRGDPSSALLEVLDPEQNDTFNDHYLDCDYDLSKVMFVTTANNLHTIPEPLKDRMEILMLSGYTELEKLSIAKKYLVDKQHKANGLQPHNVDITDAAILEIIRSYTREAGVRNLEKSIATLCRKAAVEVVEKGTAHSVKIDAKDLPLFLGQPKYRHGRKEESNQVGTVTGLAWTDKGGELLTIETTILPGKGRLQITGKLGDVMQESARAALSFVRSRHSFLGLPKDFYDKIDIHVHVPEGAIPKDGPSAGITMATSMVSALTGIPIDREVAMTGEITLRGNVLPIGGLKEKALAAHRGGIKRVLLPEENENEIEEIPAIVRSELELVPVKHMDEVLREAFKYVELGSFFKVLEFKRSQDILLYEDLDGKKGKNDRDGQDSQAVVDVVTH